MSSCVYFCSFPFRMFHVDWLFYVLFIATKNILWMSKTNFMCTLIIYTHNMRREKRKKYIYQRNTNEANEYERRERERKKHIHSALCERVVGGQCFSNRQSLARICCFFFFRFVWFSRNSRAAYQRTDRFSLFCAVHNLTIDYTHTHTH